MMYYVEYDCYNGKHICDGDHDDPNLVTIFHIDYIYLPSNPNVKVEVIIRDHDDINNPSFYILSEDRSKELYKVSLFDNSYTEGLSKEDKEALNIFLRCNYRSICEYKMVYHNPFRDMKGDWILSNMGDYDETPYDDMEVPYYE